MTEISVVPAYTPRLARSTLQVLEIMQECAGRGVELHAVKNRIVLDGTLQAKVIATVFGLAAEIERDLISARTREALGKLKASGAKLGRPTGTTGHSRLDDQADLIRRYLQQGIEKRAICRLIKCSPATLYRWIDHNMC